MVAATFEHILVFDANAGRRQLIHETLDELGYQVSLVWNAGDARRVLAQEEVDLLIADVVKVGDAAHAVMNHATSIVESPFPLEQLSDEVARVLAVRRGPLHEFRPHHGF
jgi:CheY-like chemotaxis protein